MRVSAFIALTTASAASAGAVQTLLDALSFTNREQLVGRSPELVAWVEITQGVPNIFAGSASDGSPPSPTALTDFSEDDGSVLRDLRLVFPAAYPGGLLLFTAGPTDGANPTSAIAPPAALTLKALPVDRTAAPSKGTALLS
jgi:hypothetical protein